LRQVEAAGQAFVLLLALVVWQALAWGSGGFLIAGPVEVAGWVGGHAGLLARATGATLGAALAGFVIGNAVALALAVLVLLVPRLERLVSGLALVVFCLPFVATAPVLRVLMGPGIGPQVAVAALAVYYTTYLALLVGLRAAPAAWFDLIRSYGRGRGSELLRVRARAAVPYLIAGLQIAAPAAFLGAMIGEFSGAERGLGVLTIQAMRNLDLAATWGIACVASSLSILAYLALGAAGRRLAAPPALILAPPPPEPRRGQGGGPGGRFGGWLWAPLLALAVLALWQGGMDALGLNAFFAKRPGDVWDFLVTAPEAAANRAVLAGAFAQTMILTVPGYLAGLAVGAGLAVALTLWPRLARGVLPVAIALRSVPIVTTAPLIVLGLGRGATGTVTLVAVMIFFPTLVACLNGLRQAPGQVLDVFATYAARPWARLRLAQVPAMLPAFFAAARMAVPAAVLAATVSEWLATGIGMGSLMALSYSTSAYGMLWSAVVVLSLAAVVAYVAVERLERAVLRVYGPEQLVV
jgi:ABC-type nitrate/sulfonate/bicarbonate transport system permease component